MHNTIETETEAPKRYQCPHIFTDGHRCGSPCLRSENLCYYHHTTRKPAPHPHTRRSRRSTFELPLPDPNDRSAIQHSIGQVLQRASNEIDPRRAGLLLYGLQIASLNLPKPAANRKGKPESVEIVEEITTHPELGTLAPRAEVGERTERKSVIGHLIERIMQNDPPPPNERIPQNRIPQNKDQPAPTPEPTTIPTLQATVETLHNLSGAPSFAPFAKSGMYAASRAKRHLATQPTRSRNRTSPHPTDTTDSSFRPKRKRSGEIRSPHFHQHPTQLHVISTGGGALAAEVEKSASLPQPSASLRAIPPITRGSYTPYPPAHRAYRRSSQSHPASDRRHESHIQDRRSPYSS